MKKNTRYILTFLLALALTFSVLPAITAFAADNDWGVDPSDAAFDGGDGFVPGEVLAPADSWQQAFDIAAAYGLALKSYAYGIAVLAAPDPEEAVANSVKISMSVDMDRDANSVERLAALPVLSLNMLYQTCEVAYDYDYRAAYDQGNRAAYDQGNRAAAGYGGLAPKYARPAHNYVSAPAGVTEAAPILELFSPPHSFTQWHHNAMETDRAWEISSGENVVVAVIDTGIDIGHPDFAGRISTKSYNSHTDQLGLDYVIDDFGHGTHVSGIIAGALNDSAGVSGVAYSAQIMMIKANIPEIPNSYETASLIRGINYAVQNGAAVINMSLGRNNFDGLGANELEHATIVNAVAQGVTVVCAAGNSRDSHAGFPAAYSEAIAVSAIQEGMSFDKSYSNYGPDIDIAAPGTAVYSTANGGGYTYMTGTSMASPNVAGVAALIIALHPEYTPQQVRDVLRQTARDAGELGRDDYYGAGIVNAYGAVLGVDALCSVTLDFNDGVRAPLIMKAAPGSALLNTYAPQQEGYAFAGWYINGVDALFDLTKEVISNDIYLYAKWDEPQEGMYMVEFPDTSFRREVFRMLSVDGRYRTDGTIVDQDDRNALASFTRISANNMSIADMTGLRYFTGLEELDCEANQLTALDVSKNTALIDLNCGWNQLSALDVSNNTALEILSCGANQLSSLNISKNAALVELECYINPLGAINVSHNSKLLFIDCFETQLSALDVSYNAELETLLCDGNQLSALDVSKNPALSTLWCDNNQLIAIDISNNPALRKLQCNNNLLTALDLSSNSALYDLWCYSNQLTTLDVSNNSALYYLWCSDNRLTTLDVSQNTGLMYLLCAENKLTNLDFSQNASLMYLVCNDNELTTLDVSNNSAFWYLKCTYNRLASIDSVLGWREIGLVLAVSFYFYPQKVNDITFAQAFPDPAFLQAVLQMPEWQGNRKGEDIISEADKLIMAGRAVLDVSGKNIGDLRGIEYFVGMTWLNVENNRLTQVDLTQNTALARLFCGGNQLAALDVAANTALTDLSCYANQLTELDLSHNPELKTLHCWKNGLKSVDVTRNTKLYELYCSGNRITQVDVSQNTALLSLECVDNLLTELDVSQNTLLAFLDCSYNLLSELDITKNIALIRLYCFNNQLTGLDITNNTMLASVFGILHCYNNYMTTPDNVKGWQQLGLIINSPNDIESGNFRFYNQLTPPAPIITITEQPKSGEVIIQSGGIVIDGTLTIAAAVSDGSIPTYQWYQALGKLADPATDTKVGQGPNFTIPANLFPGMYYYYCVVSAPGAVSVLSDVAALHVMMIIVD